jgi:tRNA(Ile)-lysidine synthase
MARVKPSPEIPFPQLGLPKAGESGSIYWKVSRYVTQRAGLGWDERAVIAVSGGQDSTALALLLAPTRVPALGQRTFFLAHFNHGLRSSEEANQDASFVRMLGERLGIEVLFGVGDVRAYARTTHESIEQAARMLRYRFLAEQASKVGASVVVTGHTASDQVETVLMNIIRGSGLTGLRGMLPRSAWPFGDGPDIARPLLLLTREETMMYCREMDVEPREDPTNDLLIAQRNIIRHEILPALRRLNPRVDDAIARLASAVEGDVAYLDQEVAGLWKSLAKELEGEVVFGRPQMSKLDAALFKRLIARAAGQLSSGGLPSAEHLEAVASARNSKRRWSVTLPGGVVVVAGSRNMHVVRTELTNVRASPLPVTEIGVPGTAVVGPWTIEASAGETGSDASSQTDPLAATLDADAVDGQLVVRSRKPGDRLRPLGLGGEKKLQDIFVDAKVPREERDCVPIIADERGIVWVVGHCIDERVAVTKATRRAIRLTARRNRVDGGRRGR